MGNLYLKSSFLWSRCPKKLKGRDFLLHLRLGCLRRIVDQEWKRLRCPHKSTLQQNPLICTVVVVTFASSPHLNGKQPNPPQKKPAVCSVSCWHQTQCLYYKDVCGLIIKGNTIIPGAWLSLDWLHNTLTGNVSCGRGEGTPQLQSRWCHSLSTPFVNSIIPLWNATH